MKADGKDAVSVSEVKRYRSSELQNHHGGMVLVDDHIYFGHAHNSGHPACVEFKTGDIVWKEEKGAAGGGGSAAVVYADGMLYFRYQNAKVVAHRGHARRLEGRRVIHAARAQPPRDVGAPGHRQRQALPARSGQAVVLQREEVKQLECV